MSLKGNVEAFSLAAILQSIKTNQHSGTLKIEKDKNKKLIYFTQGEVYLLSEGVKKMRKMGHHLVKNRIVSEKAIQDALIEQRQTNKLLGEILKEQGLITDEDINKILIHQIEEEIYSIFFWNYATFEFTKDFFPPEFINPVKDVKKVSFNTNSLLMEAARRMDDWQRIEKFVPTEKMIFKKNPHFPVEKLKLDSPLENVSSRFQDINGIHEVASLLTLWQLERYEGYEFLMQCSSQGAIEAIPSNELQALFQEAFSARDFKRCFDYYELALVAYRELSESFELKIFTNPEFIQSSNNYSFSCENLSDYPLSKLILTLFDNRVVGTLKISKGLDSKLIFFTGDNLWFVSKGRYSTQNFFDFFFHYWSIPSEIQHQLLEIQDKSRYFIQDTIIQTGVVSRDEFNQILQEKFHEEFCEMYLWQKVSVEFLKNECPEDFSDVKQLLLKPKNFQMNTIEVHDFLVFWHKIISRIPSKKIIFFLAAKRVGQFRGEQELLLKLDGKTTIEEIFQKIQIPLSRIFRIIYQGIKDILVTSLNEKKIKENVDYFLHYSQYRDALRLCQSAIAQKQDEAYFKQKINYIQQCGYFENFNEAEFILEGDLASFSLAEILQQLNLNKDTGTLHIYSENTDRSLYFCQGEVYMLIEEKQTSSEMVDLLGLQGKQDSFRERISGYLTEADISAAEITRIKEQLLDVFIWEGAHFEYNKNFLPQEFWSPPHGITKLSLDTNAFLVDAVRHIDHWDRIQGQIHSIHLIYIFENPEFKMEAISRFSKAPQAIYFIDGHHTIEDVLRISKIRKFDVMDLFYELSRENYIRPLTVEEAQEVANAAMAEGKAEECKKYYTHIQELENQNNQNNSEKVQSPQNLF